MEYSSTWFENKDAGGGAPQWIILKWPENSIESSSLAEDQSDLYLEIVLRRLSQVPADLGWRLTAPGLGRKISVENKKCWKSFRHLAHYLDLGTLGEIGLLPQYLDTLWPHWKHKKENCWRKEVIKFNTDSSSEWWQSEFWDHWCRYSWLRRRPSCYSYLYWAWNQNRENEI